MGSSPLRDLKLETLLNLAIGSLGWTTQRDVNQETERNSFGGNCGGAVDRKSLGGLFVEMVFPSLVSSGVGLCSRTDDVVPGQVQRTKILPIGREESIL